MINLSFIEYYEILGNGLGIMEKTKMWDHQKLFKKSFLVIFFSLKSFLILTKGIVKQINYLTAS